MTKAKNTNFYQKVANFKSKMSFTLSSQLLESISLLNPHLVGYNFAFYKNNLCQHISFGYLGLEKEEVNLTDTHTYYDIASLTKTFTATQILLLIKQGQLDLDTSAHFYLDFLQGFENITIKALLKHQTFLEIIEKYDKKKNYSSQEIARILFNKNNLRQDLKGQQNHQNKDIFRYSDLNYLFLGKILEKIKNKRLVQITEEFCKKYQVPEVFYPEQLAKIKNSKTKIAKAEQSLGELEPQDEKARWLGNGVGHAGLYATNYGLCTFLTKWIKNDFNLDERLYNQSFILQQNLTQEIFDRENSQFGLVFRNGFLSQRPNHAGFSGPFMVFDPNLKSGLCCTLNHHFPVRNQEKRNNLLMPIYKQIIQTFFELDCLKT